MNDMQERFCREYIVDLNATAAAIRAGYAEPSARQVASRMLTKDNIQNRIAELKQEIAGQIGINASWVLNRFKEISDRCMQATPVLIKDDDGQWVESGEYKFDSNGANKATEMLGKHIGFFEVDNGQKKPDAPVLNFLPAPVKPANDAP